MGGSAEADWRGCYRLDLIAQGASEYTIQSYLLAVGQLATWCAPRSPCTLSQDDFRRFWAELRCRRLQTTTLRTRLFAYRKFYKWVGSDAADGITTPRPHKQPRAPFTIADLQAMLAACLTDRDRALLLFLAGTGCRRAEVVGMKVRDIDWNVGLVRILGKGNRERWVCPGAQAMAALWRYVDAHPREDGYVWTARSGRPLDGKRLYNMVRRVAGRAGVHHAYPHRMRITMATEMMAEGMALDELQQVLGHANIQVTAHYAAYSVRRRALERQRALSLADRL
jgi:site-specific recombinase XerD